MIRRSDLRVTLRQPALQRRLIVEDLGDPLLVGSDCEVGESVGELGGVEDVVLAVARQQLGGFLYRGVEPTADFERDPGTVV